MSTVGATTVMDKERLVWAAAIVVGASLPHWPDLPLWIPVLLAACVAWRLAIAARPRDLERRASSAGAGAASVPQQVAAALWAPPPRTLRLAIAVVAFFGVLLEYRTINGVAAGSALLVVMVALKYLEARNQRDQLVLIIIAYFLMFASLLTERGMLAALYSIALVWLTTVALLQLGRHGPLLPSAATARQAGRMLLHAIPLATVLFVLFPRLPGPLWALPGNTSSASTGLSDTMSPGDITELGVSDAVAFRVDFTTPPPTADKLYWRGPVLTHFNGRTWSRAEGMRRMPGPTLTHSGSPVTYRVMLEPGGRGWAFALEMPQTWSSDRNIRMNSDYQLGSFFGELRSGRLDYEVTSYTEYYAREPLTAVELGQFTALPPDFNPRTRALVAQWLQDAPGPEVVIERALDYLRSQPFFYTLTPPALGRDSIDEFLFDTREGFCEHYASAFAFMLRAAGLPARVVTGYQGGELNGVGAYYIIRQSDAHAWTEVWLADRGWVRVDPITAVAPERVALGSSRASLEGAVLPGSLLRRIGWLHGATLLWDAAQTYWNDWIIGYGLSSQRSLLEGLGFRDLRRSERWATLLGLTLAATLALLAVYSSYLAWRNRRRAARDPAADCFARFCRKLARGAVAPRAPTEGPVHFGSRAQRALPAAAAEIEAIVAAYVRARYEPDADRAALSELERRVGAFRLA